MMKLRVFKGRLTRSKGQRALSGRHGLSGRRRQLMSDGVPVSSGRAVAAVGEAKKQRRGAAVHAHVGTREQRKRGRGIGVSMEEGRRKTGEQRATHMGCTRRVKGGAGPEASSGGKMKIKGKAGETERWR